LLPAYWYSTAAAYLWQVMLHAAVAGLVAFVWWRRLRLPSGATKRRVLGLVLVLPLMTAAIPGRDMAFRQGAAWLDSGRLLALPVFGVLQVYHLALAVCALSVVVTVVQEVLPALARADATACPAPAELVQAARALPGWSGCAVDLVPGDEILVATAGRPARPRLLVSVGALAALTPASLQAVLRHEHAHWRRWRADHWLFAARLLQAHNPVALWVFREYSVEREIACDAQAVVAADPAHLAGALLALYQQTDPRDLAARAVLRRRVDILLGRHPRTEATLPSASFVAIALTLLMLLPWLV
jgi:Zn-dependent protease with chaperone function